MEQTCGHKYMSIMNRTLTLRWDLKVSEKVEDMPVFQLHILLYSSTPLLLYCRSTQYRVYDRWGLAHDDIVENWAGTRFDLR